MDEEAAAMKAEVDLASSGSSGYPGGHVGPAAEAAPQDRTVDDVAEDEDESCEDEDLAKDDANRSPPSGPPAHEARQAMIGNHVEVNEIHSCSIAEAPRAEAAPDSRRRRVPRSQQEAPAHKILIF